MHVFESAAKAVENDHRIIRDIRALPEYAWLFFHGISIPEFGDIRGDTLFVKENWEPDQERSRLRRRGFYALAELALFTPMGPIYGEMRQDLPLQRRTWIDIHPGWRMIKALHTIERHMHLLRDFPTGYAEFQAVICEEQGWIHPERFLQSGYEIEFDDHWVTRHKMASALKRELPAVFAETVLTPDGGAHESHVSTFFAETRPLLYLGHHGYVFRGPDEHLKQIVTFFLSTWIDKLLFGDSASIIDCLPPGLEYRSLFANIDDPEAMARLVETALSIENVKFVRMI
jgi:hypothetical protein